MGYEHQINIASQDSGQMPVWLVKLDTSQFIGGNYKFRTEIIFQQECDLYVFPCANADLL